MILLRQGLDAPNSGLRLGSKTSSLEFIMEASQRLTNIKTVAFHMMERVLALVAILLDPWPQPAQPLGGRGPRIQAIGSCLAQTTPPW